MQYRTIFCFFGMLAVLGSRAHAASKLCESAFDMSEKAKTCGEDDPLKQVEQKTFINQCLSEMKVAFYRGNISKVTQKAALIEAAIKPCGSKTSADPSYAKSQSQLRYFCGSSCLHELARTKLFMANDLPYYSANDLNKNLLPGGVDFSPAASIKYASDGLFLAEKAVRFASLEQAVADGPAAGQDSLALTYNSYKKQLAKLNATKIRLLQSIGDSYYQEVGRQDLKNLSGAILDKNGIPLEKNFANAYGYYQLAYWASIEALIDVPDNDQQSMDEITIRNLQSNVITRLDSIRKGNFFLNIDPSAMSLLTTYDLKDRINILTKRIESIESTIEEKFIEAVEAQQSQGTQIKQEMRFLNSRSVEHKVYEIAKLESEYRLLEGKLNKDLQQLDLNQDKIDLEIRIRENQYELQKAIATKDFRLNSLKQRQELDLLEVDKERLRDERDNLRWQIEQKVLTANFNLQKASFAQQLAKEEARIEQIEGELVEVAKSRDQLVERSISLDARIEGLRKRKESVEEAKTNVFKANQIVIHGEICAMDAQLAYLGVGASGLCNTGVSRAVNLIAQKDKICRPDTGLIAQFNKASSDAQDKILACIGSSGGACPGLSADALTALKSIADANKEALKASTDGFEKLSQQYDADIKALTDALNDFNNEANRLNKDVTAKLVEKLGAVAAATPTSPPKYVPDHGPRSHKFSREIKLTLGRAPEQEWVQALVMGVASVAGMASGFWGNGQAEEGMKYAKKSQIYAEVVELRNATLSQLTTRNDYRERIANLAREQIALLNELNVRMSELNIESLNLELTKAQLTIQQQGALGEKRIIDARIVLDIQQCLVDQGALESNRDQLKASRQALIASLNARKAENGLLDFESSALAADIRSLQAEKRVNQSDEAKFIAREKALGKEKEAVERVMASLKEQDGIIEDTQNTIDKIKSQVNAVSTLIADLLKTEKGSIIKLSVDESAYVTSIFNIEDAMIEKRQKELSDKRKFAGVKETVLDDFYAVQENINRDILKSRNDILETVKLQAAQDPGDLHQYFLASDAQIASVIRGIPDYVEMKKDLMHEANFVMNLYRQRVNALKSIIGKDTDSKPWPYAHNWKAVTTLVGANCLSADLAIPCPQAAPIYNNQTFAIESVMFTIDTGSGLMRDLLTKRKGRFMISPSAVAVNMEKDPFNEDVTDLDTSASIGRYLQWSPKVFDSSANLRLLNMFVAVDKSDDPSCLTERIEVSHKGWGYSLNKKSSDDFLANLEVGIEREIKTKLYALSATQNPDYLEFERLKRPSGAFTMSKYEADDVNSLALLGAPLIGQYELTLPAGNCVTSNSSLQILLWYTRQ